MGKPMSCDKNNFGCKHEDGIALIMTLLFLVALGVLSTALVFTVGNEMKTSAAYKYTQEAFYVSNAGAQKALIWFNNNYSPHLPSSDYDATSFPVRYSGSSVMLAGQTGSSSVYPDSSVTTAFTAQFGNQSLQADANNSGVYALNTTLLKYTPANFIDPTTFVSYPSAMERWRINSLGYWGTVASPLGMAQITAIIENSGNAMFDRAFWGIDSIDLGGTVLVDSYDPALGSYGGTNIGNNGAIGSNGSVSTNGNVTIKGDVAFGPAGTFTEGGGTVVTGDIIHLSEPHYFPPIPSFSVGTTDYNPKNGTTTLNPGSYGSVTIGAKGILALNPGVYYFDSITENSTGQLTISGPTTIFVKTDLDLSGQGVANPLGDPTKLTIFYSGTNEMSITGGASAYVEVYAPNAPLKAVGNSDFFGSFIGKTVTVQGTPQMHFDEGCLKEHLFQRPFRLMTWSQDIY
jgi:Tfp pilus assembly protein PilX